MSNYLVVLSGNVGVGKSTIGPYLAEYLSAKWLSESSISSQFDYLFADENKYSRLISQISFSSLRMATILSSFIGGTDKIVSERFLWDSLIFHEVWREQFQLGEYDEFFHQFYNILNKHSTKFSVITIWLKCSVEMLIQRARIRGEAFDKIHTRSLLEKLERKYEIAFTKNPPSNVFTFDVSNIENTEKSIKQFAKKITTYLPDFV